MTTFHGPIGFGVVAGMYDLVPLSGDASRDARVAPCTYHEALLLEPAYPSCVLGPRDGPGTGMSPVG